MFISAQVCTENIRHPFCKASPRIFVRQSFLSIIHKVITSTQGILPYLTANWGRWLITLLTIRHVFNRIPRITRWCRHGSRLLSFQPYCKQSLIPRQNFMAFARIMKFNSLAAEDRCQWSLTAAADTILELLEAFRVVHKGRPQKYCKNRPAPLDHIGPFPPPSHRVTLYTQWTVTHGHPVIIRCLWVTAVGIGRTQCWLQAVSGWYPSIHPSIHPSIAYTSNASVYMLRAAIIQLVTLSLFLGSTPERWA